MHFFFFFFESLFSLYDCHTSQKKKLINKIRKLYHSAVPEMSVDPKKNYIHHKATFRTKVSNLSATLITF